MQGYAVLFGIGCGFIYAVFVGFLGPAFVTGVCPVRPGTMWQPCDVVSSEPWS